MPRQQAAARRVGLADRLDAFDEALALAASRAEAEALAAARAVRARVDERLARGERLIVAAFAGGTGTGKSSLFNAVAREAIAEIGVRRPTTEEPQALVAGDLSEAHPLLDWLGVRRRHVADRQGLPEGLILVDLPDHDSVARHHHVTSARFAERADLLVWVVDPLKYSRRDFHDEALRPLAEHAEVLVVVMNHADELSPEGRRACVDDLRRLLDAEGLTRARLLVTSARTGEGLDALRALVAEEAARRRAAAARVAADVRAAAKQLRACALREARPAEARPDTTRLVDALAGAAGAEGRADAAAAEYRNAARAGSRPLLNALVALLWALARRALRGARSLFEQPGGARAEKPPGPASVAVSHALHELVAGVSGGLPTAARDRLRAAAGVDPEALGRALGRAVDAVPLRPARRRWWGPTRAVLSLFELLALVGAAWLGMALLVDWLRLPELPLPMLAGELPWPTALLLGGLAARLLGGLLRRRAVRRGAQRHAAGVRARLRRAVERVTDEHVAAPVGAELERLARLDAALERAAA